MFYSFIVLSLRNTNCGSGGVRSKNYKD